MVGQLTLERRAHPQREAPESDSQLAPQNHPHHQNLQPVPVEVIQAVEENPPLGVAPVNWL
jgi:hypothetical protein